MNKIETALYLLEKQFDREWEADQMKEAARTRRMIESLTQWMQDFERSEQCQPKP